MSREVRQAKVSGDVYQMLTAMFAQKHGMDFESRWSQWEVVKEEWEELEEAFENEESGSAIRNEVVDLMFTLFLLGELHGWDLRWAFVKKSAYNLQKSTERDENGKVTDDV